jgi:hypothetical protein
MESDVPAAGEVSKWLLAIDDESDRSDPNFAVMRLSIFDAEA